MTKRFFITLVVFFLLAGASSAETTEYALSGGGNENATAPPIADLFKDLGKNSEMKFEEFFGRKPRPEYDAVSQILVQKYTFEKENKKDYSTEINFICSWKYDFDIFMEMEYLLGYPRAIIGGETKDEYTKAFENDMIVMEITRLLTGKRVDVIINDFYDLIKKYQNAVKTEHAVVTGLDLDSFMKSYSGKKTINAILDTDGE